MTSAAIMTFDTLVEDIQSYMERTDTEFIAQIPRLILLAEQTVAANIKSLWETTVLNTQIQSGQYRISKPARWRKTLSFKVAPSLNTNIPPSQPLLMRDQTFVALYNGESAQAQPTYYADWDYDNWVIAPRPDQAYNIEIVYQGRIQPLDSTNQVNLITRECPQLLLYACMVEAALYLKSFEKLQVWQPMFDRELQALKGEDGQRYIDKNSKRDQE
ncbi:MAG: hypothetical protein ORN28_07040 [Rhodoferax sp.]|nr:hypothetical protein [Rhodoferax sp.]